MLMNMGGGIYRLERGPLHFLCMCSLCGCELSCFPFTFTHTCFIISITKHPQFLPMPCAPCACCCHVLFFPCVCFLCHVFAAMFFALPLHLHTHMFFASFQPQNTHMLHHFTTKHTIISTMPCAFFHFACGCLCMCFLPLLP